jgi:hypothetical protein
LPHSNYSSGRHTNWRPTNSYNHRFSNPSPLGPHNSRTS